MFDILLEFERHEFLVISLELEVEVEVGLLVAELVYLAEVVALGGFGAGGVG